MYSSVDERKRLRRIGVEVIVTVKAREEGLNRRVFWDRIYLKVVWDT